VIVGITRLFGLRFLIPDPRQLCLGVRMRTSYRFHGPGAESDALVHSVQITVGATFVFGQLDPKRVDTAVNDQSDFTSTIPNTRSKVCNLNCVDAICILFPVVKKFFVGFGFSQISQKIPERGW
jgi:hypothetical protein